MKRYGLMIKALSFLLINVLIISMMSGTAFARENTNSEMGCYQKIFESIGLETETMKTPIAGEEVFRVYYNSGDSSMINKKILTNGDVEITIVEGDLTNVMVIKPNGETYVDNSLITIGNLEGNFSPLISDYNAYTVAVQPRLNDYNFTTTCPYGSPSDYTDERVYNDVVNLGTQVFSNITKAAWVGIIVGLIGALSAPAGLVAPLFIEGALTKLQSIHPSANASSLKTVKAFHKTKGYNVKAGMSVAKYSVTYYANDDFTGVIKDSAGKYVFSGYDVFTY